MNNLKASRDFFLHILNPFMIVLLLYECCIFALKKFSYKIFYYIVLHSHFFHAKWKGKAEENYNNIFSTLIVFCNIILEFNYRTCVYKKFKKKIKIVDR